MKEDYKDKTEQVNTQQKVLHESENENLQKN